MFYVPGFRYVATPEIPAGVPALSIYKTGLAVVGQLPVVLDVDRDSDDLSQIQVIASSKATDQLSFTSSNVAPRMRHLYGPYVYTPHTSYFGDTGSCRIM
jgi:hypothetical protein